MLILYVICIYLLLKLFVEDWKSRSVHWYLFPCILVCTIFINSNSIQNYWSVIVLNLTVVFIQFGIIILYLKLRGYNWKNLTSSYFALGDILFLIVLSFSLSTEMFLIFNIDSILISLLFARILKWKTIPFAGIQSLLLALVWVFNLVIK